MFSFSKRCLTMVVFAAVVLLSVPAVASLPYYNQNLGYTIWLSEDWVEASDTFLSQFSQFHDGVAANMAGWEAGYTLNSGASLLVSELHGRVVSKTNIGNFNQFVIRELQRTARTTPSWSKQDRINLNKANFDAQKNTLRLEMEIVAVDGQRMTSIVYIVYTSNGMLKFVGLTQPGNVQGVQAIDEAVASLYLDYGLRQ